MPHDPRVDAYIAHAAPFARPVLTHLRAIVHDACGDITETIKWGRPFFMLDGRPLAMMSAFTAHAGFGFWQGGALGATAREAEASGQFGKLTTLADVPDAALIREHVVKAVALIRSDAPPARKPRVAKLPLETPPDLTEALAGAAEARAAFGRLPPSGRRDYVEWVTGAKRPETRARRIATTIDRLTAGKRMNAEYQ